MYEKKSGVGMISESILIRFILEDEYENKGIKFSVFFHL